ncbi:MAG: glycoside hydrolase family 65 protein [Eubacterium sp.]|jgi:trehalose/maltose hydrolase-like predicted phosphorylase|nr:glycoside hydrolase family 65 protein [Eubacterium sp.]
MSWIIEEKGYKKDNVELNGNKFLLGNGYMGYRGTLEEFEKGQLVACNLLGVYDKVGDKWREPVNAPNGFYTGLSCDQTTLGTLNSETPEHSQWLDIKSGLHSRRSVFSAPEGNRIEVESQRFLGLFNVHLMCMKYSIKAANKCNIEIKTGIDGEVWDINGPHLTQLKPRAKGEQLVIDAATGELGCKVSVAESMAFAGEAGVEMNQQIVAEDKKILRKVTFKAQPGQVYTFFKYVSVYTGNDGVEDPSASAEADCLNAKTTGYDELSARNTAEWGKRWKISDVKISGDDTAQLALRYSIYHLLSIAPAHSDKASIPARGLSGQVYKGAIFWDTEMFMLPFFLYTNPDIARNLMRYRVHTLDGARRKAVEYGYRGAYYAWESQDTGDDACTHFNVTDVFTGRPMRTYFRDKQIHISTDVVYGIWQYFSMTGDESILLEGGAEVILECARFLMSYAYFKKDKNRYEILDVTGPDEYHERVNNNAFTNKMVKNTLEVAGKTLKLLKEKHAAVCSELVNRLGYEPELDILNEMNELLYIPQPDGNSLVIEQFDGYHRLEDISLKELKSRIIDPNEYLGGGNGIAATTKILKQADTVLMLNLFKDRYSYEVKKANWEYYEPRTEHGSSLSPCVYALLATDIGNPEWAYKYFLKTATIDLTGESKQYAGTIYIGGTHPAANGGAWMAAILGFAGVSCSGSTGIINPRLPAAWDSLEFNLVLGGQIFGVAIDKSSVTLHSEEGNTADFIFYIAGQPVSCKPEQSISVNYN